MKRIITVKFAHWWYWFIPSYWRARKLLQALLDREQDVMLYKLQKAFNEATVYGTSVVDMLKADNEHN